MESINVLLFVGTFTLCVFAASASDCNSDLALCIGKLSAHTDMNNIPLLCNTLNETINCINKASEKCPNEQATEIVKSNKMQFEQQYSMLCGSAGGCSLAVEYSKCYPSNFRPDPNMKINLENCKTMMPMVMCVKEIPKRCPNLKAQIDPMLNAGEAEMKACEKLLTDSNPSTTKAPKTDHAKPKDSHPSTTKDSNPNTSKAPKTDHGKPKVPVTDNAESSDKDGKMAMDTKPKDGGASATQWSGLLLIMAAIVTGGFIYV